MSAKTNRYPSLRREGKKEGKERVRPDGLFEKLKEERKKKNQNKKKKRRHGTQAFFLEPRGKEEGGRRGPSC